MADDFVMYLVVHVNDLLYCIKCTILIISYLMYLIRNRFIICLN